MLNSNLEGKDNISAGAHRQQDGSVGKSTCHGSLLASGQAPEATKSEREKNLQSCPLPPHPLSGTHLLHTQNNRQTEKVYK